MFARSIRNTRPEPSGLRRTNPIHRIAGVVLLCGSQLHGCHRKGSNDQARACPEPKKCPECPALQPALPKKAERTTDVFSFGQWRARLSDKGGRCKVTFEAYGKQRAVVEKALDLVAPCYVSRWSSTVPTGREGPRDTTKAHGAPGDAQVWQFGLQPKSAVFVTAIMGFDPAMALPEDRSDAQRAKRCSNASQAIRLQGANQFSLGEPWSSPKLVYCALETFDITRFAIAAEDLFPRNKPSLRPQR